MKLFFKSYGGAQELLHLAGVLEPLVQRLKSTPTPLWQKKSKTAGLCVLPPVLNALIESHFGEQGWSKKPRICKQTRFEGDFAITAEGLKILCEVQLGNTARADSDLVKFQMALEHGNLDVALEIVPMDRMARRMNQNTANFERTTSTFDALSQTLLKLNLPILVIGFDVDESEVMELSQYFPGQTYKSVSNQHKIRLAKELLLCKDPVDLQAPCDEQDHAGTLTCDSLA